AAGERRHLLKCDHRVYWVAFADGKTLATAGGTEASGRQAGELKLWDLGGEAATLRIALSAGERPVPCVTISPDGRLLAAPDGYYGIKLWDARTGQPRAGLHSDAQKSWLAFGPGGKT